MYTWGMNINVEQLVIKYLNVLERENERLLSDNEQMALLIQEAQDEEEEDATIKEDYEKALEDIDKRDSIIWKLGIALNGKDKKIADDLARAVAAMHKDKSVPDMDELVDSVYRKIEKVDLDKKKL